MEPLAIIEATALAVKTRRSVREREDGIVNSFA